MTTMTEEAKCRICWEDDVPNDLLRPCKCKGSMGYVHAECWKKAHFACSLCKYTAPSLHSNMLQIEMFTKMIKDNRKHFLFSFSSMVKDAKVFVRYVALYNVLPFWAFLLLTTIQFSLLFTKPVVQRYVSYGLLLISLYMLEQSSYGRAFLQVCGMFVSMRIFLGVMYYNEKAIKMCATMMQAYQASFSA